jgi:hypothetical protein
MSVTPRLAHAAWNDGSALMPSASAIHSSIMIGGCAPGTGTLAATAPAARSIVIIQVSPAGLA